MSAWTKSCIFPTVTLWVGLIGRKIHETKCSIKCGQKIGWVELSHCDSWSKILGYKCSFFGWTNCSSTLGFGLGRTVTRAKQTTVQLSLGPTVWVELSLGLNVGGLNVKAPMIGDRSV
jgi:hypothetical protein